MARLLRQKRREFPFTITGIHTLRHGTAVSAGGLPLEPDFGPRMASVGRVSRRRRADAAVELTTLNPSTGEPAITHIRAAFARRMHVVTANKGPIAHAYAALRDEAARAGVSFRFESAVMDGAPVFNLWRECLPAVKVQGFTGVLNSTSKVVIESMEHGGSFEEGLADGARHGDHRGRRSIRYRRLGFRRENSRAGQRPDGRAHNAATGVHSRHRAINAGARAARLHAGGKRCVW